MKVDLGLPSPRDRQTVEFRPYTELPRRVSRKVWLAARCLPIAVYLAVCVILVGNPQRGLDLLWGVIIPWLPALFLVAPGVWRNLCPLASLNQTPRLLGFSRAGSAPAWMRERGYVLGMLAFLGLVAARRPLLNSHGRLTAAIMLITMTAAFMGGLLIKGKGGWCSSICPVLPVQRLYGQTPFLVSPNAHCSTCVGCAKNCYDFNPTAAYQADLNEVDPDWSAPRKAFAGAMPALVFAYFTIPQTSAHDYLARLGLYLLAGVGSIFAVNAVTRISWSRLAGAYAALAFALFYWWSPRGFVAAVHRQFHLEVGFVDVPLRVAAIGLAVVWGIRTMGVAERFRARRFQQAAAKVSPERIARVRGTEGTREVTFEPDGITVAADEGMTLLDLAERSGVRLEAGCRMGMCGADPVRVLDGAECVTPMTDDERSTLSRMGLGDDIRLACCVQVCGPVTVSTDYKRSSAGGTTAVAPAIRTGPRLLVIGGGIAGITAAETARRVDPNSRISIVGRESYPLYNRMGISRVVHGRSAMQGLHLLPETWYDDQGIDSWLNTEVASLDLEEKVARLATGEAVGFDRLILATGATPNRPPLDGGHLPGVAVLRTAQDAVRIRAYAQQCPAPDRRAVVAGAGLLGLEVAHALHQFGFAVTVLERNDRLMPKVIDAAASAHLAEYLDLVGITLRTRAQVATVDGDGDGDGGIRQVTLTDGTELPAQLLVVCVGVRPELRLATEAGLATRAGILVDDTMRTSHPDVFAAGDVAEHAGVLPGLWPVAVAQARIAGENAAGGAACYTPKPVVVLLKGVGISLVAAGRIEPGPAEHVISFEGPGTHAYLRVVLRDDVVVGALSLARPPDVQLLPDGIGLTRRQFLDRLRVEDRPAPTPASPAAAVP